MATSKGSDPEGALLALVRSLSPDIAVFLQANAMVVHGINYSPAAFGNFEITVLKRGVFFVFVSDRGMLALTVGTKLSDLLPVEKVMDSLAGGAARTSGIDFSGLLGKVAGDFDAVHALVLRNR